MVIETEPAADRKHLLPELPVLRARLTLRLLEPAVLPKYKGGMLRGGFGYAFQRSTCPAACRGASNACAVETICPYRWVFETPHPPGLSDLHDLRDVPRPFVIEPFDDHRTHYAAGETLEWGLVLIGRGIDYLPYFLFGFEQLGRMGLGGQRAKARLERVEALPAWQPVGQLIYQDGRAVAENRELPLVDEAIITARASSLSADLQLRLRTPLRLKTRGDWLRAVEPAALVQALCWRLNALAIFHGGGRWNVDHRALVEQARGIAVEQSSVHWVDWGRTSTRGGQSQHMILGGIVGSAVLRGVAAELRAVLLLGSLVHVGKACVFGHGGFELAAVNTARARETNAGVPPLDEDAAPG